MIGEGARTYEPKQLTRAVAESKHFKPVVVVGRVRVGVDDISTVSLFLITKPHSLIRLSPSPDRLYSLSVNLNGASDIIQELFSGVAKYEPQQ